MVRSRLVPSLLFLQALSSSAVAQFEQAWSVTYDGPDSLLDVARGIAVDEAGFVYVTGSSERRSVGNYWRTLKYGPEGRLAWSVQGTGGIATSIAVGSSGHVYVTDGSRWTSYDSDGRVRDEVLINLGLNLSSSLVRLDSAENVYVGGTNISGRGEVIVAKYDADGFQQWVHRIQENRDNFLKGMAVDPEGNVYVTAQSSGISDTQFLTRKLDTNGESLWTAWEAVSGYPAGLSIDGLGNCFVTGHSFVEDSTRDALTIKYRGDGSVAWRVFTPGTEPGEEYAPQAVLVDCAGNAEVIVASFPRNERLRFLHEAVTGELTVTSCPSYCPSSLGSGEAITRDRFGNVYVASTARPDYVVEKYIPRVPAFPGDCNANSIVDECDIRSGVSQDCDGNGEPDECAADCNSNGSPDTCDLASGPDEDCNLNGRPDACDISSGDSADANRNALPDDCEVTFIRGDTNEDGELDLSDAVALLLVLFEGRQAPACSDAMDGNDDGTVDISDAIGLLGYILTGGFPPPPPTGGCGLDDSPDGLTCNPVPSCEA